jgi:hypothetical protein
MNQDFCRLILSFMFVFEIYIIIFELHNYMRTFIKIKIIIYAVEKECQAV